MKHKYSKKKKIGKRKNKSTKKYKLDHLPDGFVPIKKISEDKSVIEESQFESSEKKIQELIKSRNKSIKQEEIQINEGVDTLSQTTQNRIDPVDIKNINLVKINDTVFELKNELSQMVTIHEKEKRLFSQSLEKIKEKLDQIENLLK